MEKRMTFNKNPKGYEAYRPSYPSDLYRAIDAYRSLESMDSLLEIGIGTGQATKPFLDSGLEVLALELGEELARFVADKFKTHKNFKVKNMAFEDYQGKGDFDLIYAATSFHWIPEPFAYERAYQLLKHQGVIALFWNRPSTEENALHEAFQGIYQQYFGESLEARPPVTEKYESVQRALKNSGFSEVTLNIFERERRFNGEAYCGLLDTYSDHLMLKPTDKSLFYEEIRKVIRAHGDEIIIKDHIDLHLARKT